MPQPMMPPSPYLMYPPNLTHIIPPGPFNSAQHFSAGHHFHQRRQAQAAGHPRHHPSHVQSKTKMNHQNANTGPSQHNSSYRTYSNETPIHHYGPSYNNQEEKPSPRHHPPAQVSPRPSLQTDPDTPLQSPRSKDDLLDLHKTELTRIATLNLSPTFPNSRPRAEE